jgi:asparagine synthase (glutamine-hydrolysing)
MSGIAGRVQTTEGAVSPFEVTAMLEALHRRGPDCTDSWHDRQVSFGHAMLCTTPEASREQLPWCDEAASLVITSDARLDNRDELIQILGRITFRTEVIPDSRIILAAYQKWGRECVHQLVGDFAFAIWDRTHKELFCARDFLGVKPFNYCFSKGLFFFCSEAEVIAQHSGLSFAINTPRIADSLTPHLEGYDKTSTFYQGIYRLPPAHSLVLRQNKLTLSRYWQPTPQTPRHLKSDRDYQDALTEILTQAVSDRCRGIASPAILLSGGVDSATLMGIARTMYQPTGNGRLQTYSGVSATDPSCVESKMIQQLIASGGITAHTYSPADFRNIADAGSGFLSAIQEPFDICMSLIFLLYQQASTAGSRVMLDGIDGDVIGSLPLTYPARLFRKGCFREGLRETRLQHKLHSNSYHSLPELLTRYLFSAFTPQRLSDLRWRYRSAHTAEKMLNQSIARPSFASSTHLRNRLLQFEREHRRAPFSPTHEFYHQQVQHPFLTVALERYDRVASLCSIEPRHPLLDKRVIDFYAGLPWNQFSSGGRTKPLLRKVAEQYLPPTACWRTGKEHVGWEFNEALLRHQYVAITNALAEQQKQLGKILKSENTFQNTQKYYKTNGYTEVVPPLNVAGLALWLERISA